MCTLNCYGNERMEQPCFLSGGPMAALHFDWRELEMDIYQVDFLKHQRFYMLMLPVFQGLRLDL